MHTLHTYENRNKLDQALAKSVSEILVNAVNVKGKASIAVSGGSTPKGFFNALSQLDLPWQDITITLADERWVTIDSDASNTRLVFENLIQNKAVNAKFFHLKQGEHLNEETLADLNLAANSSILPFDVVILGMGEDGHTASLFPCSDQIDLCLADNSPPLIKVEPKSAPHERISFSFNALKQSNNVFLHIVGTGKEAVLQEALANTNVNEMPIRAFLQSPAVNTQVFWAE
ncbi:6-phosphogluconolactonase [Thalassotalea fusca]